MAQPNNTQRLSSTEEALTVLLCLVDDAYSLLNPRARHYESIKRFSTAASGIRFQGESQARALAISMVQSEQCRECHPYSS